MKILISAITALILCFSSITIFEVHGDGEINVTVNDSMIEFDVSPIIVNGRTMVPVRGVFESLDAKVSWFEETKTVLVLKENTRIYLIVDSLNAYVNEELVKLDVPAKIINGRTLVPIRFISETLGAKVSWDENNRTVRIDVDNYPYSYNESMSIEYLSEKYQDNMEFLIGSPLEYIEFLFGIPDRVDLSKYGFDWYIYNSDLEKYLMIGIEDDTVVGLYSNSKYYKLNENIGFATSKPKVSKTFGSPLQYYLKNNTQFLLSKENKDNDKVEYEVYNIKNRYYTTIFYDIHNDEKVTSFMLIDYETENSLVGFYGEPSKELTKSYERQIFDLANAVRKRHDKPSFVLDERAANVAREHSKDMALNNFFAHKNLKEESPFDRLKNGEISFSYAGENIAAGQMCGIFAHEAWMNSKKGHREAILDDFKYLGVGVYLDSTGNTTYTQNFYTPLKSRKLFFRF
ncbi:stalk domain-containing protein [Herbivorax sp. ANBcel31]|uniref:stalk domain-containing protein n=1 Tax=Herbivorax sp. ANBcel31 TaxID=3069754 RepID=UPI0027B46FD5|nr:stalk domain-containing protein [Herbivorax sp. ANBcel31]MDQ2087005.1 stalk domain-containing protein [Herbivorax sp. ANBcel31]